MNGREYFAKWERKLHIEGADPASLKPGALESRVGGNISTRDLKRLTPEEIQESRKLSEEFLKQPAEHFPAEEEEDEEE
jgi:DNA-binding transcriptional regulator YdaS (Cro superfamily)